MYARILSDVFEEDIVPSNSRKDKNEFILFFSVFILVKTGHYMGKVASRDEKTAQRVQTTFFSFKTSVNPKRLPPHEPKQRDNITYKLQTLLFKKK